MYLINAVQNTDVLYCSLELKKAYAPFCRQRGSKLRFHDGRDRKADGSSLTALNLLPSFWPSGILGDIRTPIPTSTIVFT